MSEARAETIEVSPEWRKLLDLLPGFDPCLADPERFYFDHEAAESACRFIETFCTHVKGRKAREPYILEPIERAIVGAIFGFKRISDQLRRFREVLYFVARKNSKSTLGAAIMLCVMFTDGEPGAELYSTAADREQAALIHGIAARMIEQDEELSKHAQIYTTTKAITFGSQSFKSLSSDAGTKHGANAHFVLNDELHAHRTPELVDVMETSMGARAQPLTLHITTADYDRENSICNLKHEYGEKVRDGVIEDPSFLPLIFQAEPQDDWTDPEVWAKANPLLGKSVSIEFLDQMCRKAQEQPRFENTFKRLHLNMKTEQAVRWIPLAKWDECAGKLDRICTIGSESAADLLGGLECYGGLDLSSTRDISALALFFPDLDALIWRFWIPGDRAQERSNRDRVPYVEWVNQGLIIPTDGDVIDYNVIEADILEAWKIFNIREIAVDRWNSTQMQQNLSDQGMAIVQFGQGFASMNAPTKELEKRIWGGQLQHGGNPVARWMISNVSVRTDPAGNIKPDKERSAEKIDGVVAAIMALGLAMVSEDAMPGVYAL